MVTKRYKVALVDDNAANLAIGKSMLKEDYEVFPMQSSQRLFTLLEKVPVDLILLDVDMPVMNGYDTIRLLKQQKKYVDIPVIFLTAMTDEEQELEGLELGAVDYVMKPFRAQLLKKRIESHILISQQQKELLYNNEFLQDEVDEKSHQVQSLQDTVLMAVTEMVEFRDGNTGGHIYRTREYLRLLVNEAVSLGIYDEVTCNWDVELLISSAPLHDIGKIAISDAILNKPGKLTVDEFEIMKNHVKYGVRAIDKLECYSDAAKFLRYAKTIAGAHHEKWDGTGYPHGLSGEAIPLEGRLMAIADVYDALTSYRSYKEAMKTEQAEGIIREDAGTHFDENLIEVFDRVKDRFAEIAIKGR
jgi:putative two-component system response regulator